jgi:hypothetical protein
MKYHRGVHERRSLFGAVPGVVSVTPARPFFALEPRAEGQRLLPQLPQHRLLLASHGGEDLRRQLPGRVVGGIGYMHHTGCQQPVSSTKRPYAGYEGDSLPGVLQ